MKFFVSILLALSLLASPVANAQWAAVLAGSPPAAAGGAAFSDDFDRADSDSLGANWTEAVGDADISSNTYLLATSSFGVITSVYNTATGSATQYVKITFGVDCQYPWIVLRYLDSSNGYYTLQFDGNSGGVDWYYFSDAADTTGALIGTGTFSQDLAGDTIGATITGTGNSTVVRLWLNPTNLPTAAGDWDGDATPNVTISDDPATAADAGQLVGIGGQQNGNTVRLNNFFGGGL